MEIEPNLLVMKSLVFDTELTKKKRPFWPHFLLFLERKFSTSFLAIRRPTDSSMARPVGQSVTFFFPFRTKRDPLGGEKGRRRGTRSRNSPLWPPPPPPPHLVLRKRLFFSLSLSSLKRRRTARAWGSTVFNEEKEDEIEERGWGVGGEGGGKKKEGKTVSQVGPRWSSGDRFIHRPARRRSPAHK